MKNCFRNPETVIMALKLFRQKKKRRIITEGIRMRLIEEDTVEVGALIKAGISQRLSVCRQLLEGISFTTSNIDMANSQVTNRVAAFRFAILNSKYEIKIFAS